MAEITIEERVVLLEKGMDVMGKQLSKALKDVASLKRDNSKGKPKGDKPVKLPATVFEFEGEKHVFKLPKFYGPDGTIILAEEAAKDEKLCALLFKKMPSVFKPSK